MLVLDPSLVVLGIGILQLLSCFVLFPHFVLDVRLFRVDDGDCGVCFCCGGDGVKGDGIDVILPGSCTWLVPVVLVVG